MIDKESFLARIEAATKEAEKWAVTGWPMTFGDRNAPVSSLAAAEEAPESFVYRQEALAYWRHVDEMGKETAEWGRKAVDALRAGDHRAVVDALYFARFTEKKINKEAPTWGEVTTIAMEEGA